MRRARWMWVMAVVVVLALSGSTAWAEGWGGCSSPVFAGPGVADIPRARAALVGDPDVPDLTGVGKSVTTRADAKDRGEHGAFPSSRWGRSAVAEWVSCETSLAWLAGRRRALLLLGLLLAR